MPKLKGPRGRLAVTACVAALTLFGATAAQATACRITDFSDKPLSSLSEKQRLSFITEMTQTEYARIKALRQGDPNFDPIIAASSTISDAREAAYKKLESFNIENIDHYRRTWATDWLTDKGLQDLTNCISTRQPGLLVVGRRDTAEQYNLTITHLTPIGIEKITTKLVATYNVANVAEIEAVVAKIGARDNYRALTFPVKLGDPNKHAVVILRAGWETPVQYYIPAPGI